MPPVILTEKDIWSFYYPDTEANFITLGNVSGDCVVIESGTANEEIADKILLIPSADPGYDWVFPMVSGDSLRNMVERIPIWQSGQENLEFQQQ